MAASSSSSPSSSHSVPVVILGSDALLAALPATPVQLAHACLRAGFASVIPASWGDELIAAAVLRHLPEFGTGPAIQCSCPIVAHRLLNVGGDLRHALLSLVPPPVALARYVKRMSEPTRTRVTYVGACPGALDDAIDVRMTPEALIDMLAERAILLDDQPRVFESIIPSDRRRFRSQPGGLPAAESMWTEVGPRTIAEIEGDDLVGELAQLLLSGRNVLIDAATRLGCVCSGAVAGASPKAARASVTALEPPRATSPIVEEHAPIDLELSLPAAPRTALEVVAGPQLLGDRPSSAPSLPAFAPQGTMPLGHRISPVRGLGVVPEPRAPRTSSPVNPRPVLGALPVARDVEGKSLPRAYVARRRSSPKGIPAVSPQTHADANFEAPDADLSGAAAPASVKTPLPSPPPLPPRFSPLSGPAVEHSPEAQAVATSVAAPSAAPSVASLLSAPLTMRHAVLLLIAVLAFAFSISTVVAVVVGRALRQTPPPAAASSQR